MNIKKTFFLTSLVILLVALTAITVVICKRLLYLDTYKANIITAAQNAIQRRITYENGDFSLAYGPTFTFTKVTVMEKDAKSAFMYTDKLTLRVALLPLLEKKLVFRKVILERPHFSLSRDKSGIFNFSDLMVEKKKESPLGVRSINIKNGSATCIDQAISAQGVTTTIKDLDLFVSRLARGKNSEVRISARIPEGGIQSTVSFSGKMKLAGHGKSLFDTFLSGKIEAKNLSAAHYGDYYIRHVPFQKIIGRFAVTSTFKGKLADFSAHGAVRVTGLNFTYPGIFHAPLKPKEVRFTYDMELTPKDLTVKQLNLTVDGLNVKGTCALRDIHSNDLFISAKATTNSFRLEQFGGYIPFGVIPDDVANYIDTHIKGGTYRLQEGKLEGRVSQIAHMERGTNYNVLFIRGTVEKGLVTYGTDTPTFNNIKGNLAMRGKDFILSGMEGRFGNSPFTLEGRITDYPLNKPSAYPFTMTMTPGQAEAAWLFGPRWAGKFTLQGKSTLNLAGNGYTTGYNLNGKWDLTDAACSFSNVIHKPVGQPNTLSFKSNINGEQARISALQYSLGSMQLNASGRYRFAGERNLFFSIDTNQFPVQDAAPLVPVLGKYQPAGKIQVAISGRSRTRDLDRFVLQGNVALAGVSLKPTGDMQPLNGITGIVHVNDERLSTSFLTARLGNSVVQGSGVLTGFKNPTVNLIFSSAMLYPADFGLRGKISSFGIQKVRGDITFKDKNIKIRSFSGAINKSAITLRGSITDVHKPAVDLVIHAPYLELDDILLFKGIETGKKGGKESPFTEVTGQAKVYAETGKIEQFPFNKLYAHVFFEKNSVSLKPLEMKLLEGTLTAKGQIETNVTGGPRYHTTFDLKNISAAQLLHTMQAKRDATGSLSLQGELAATGESFAEIRRTVTGNARLHCQDGKLRKFSVLSKIFSILNVSQLLKFQLPDMVSGGMPYNKITGTFTLQDGTASTNDLFIDSDAINISVVGKFNLEKENLDLTVGVKPLQTVDKIVSRIPIVGWVLTGKNRSLITAYFEAKGNWDNPEVKAIPIKSLAKGAFGIFKRVFQLPAKLVTNTGEVIIGK